MYDLIDVWSEILMETIYTNLLDAE